MDEVLKYSPDQPRDERGRFTTAPGSSAAPSNTTAASRAEARANLETWALRIDRRNALIPGIPADPHFMAYDVWATSFDNTDIVQQAAANLWGRPEAELFNSEPGLDRVERVSGHDLDGNPVYSTGPDNYDAADAYGAAAIIIEGIENGRPYPGLLYRGISLLDGDPRSMVGQTLDWNLSAAAPNMNTAMGYATRDEPGAKRVIFRIAEGAKTFTEDKVNTQGEHITAGLFKVTGYDFDALRRTHILDVEQVGLHPSPVLKFNPYHDERGRFTTAPGGTAAGAASAPQKRGDYNPTSGPAYNGSDISYHVDKDTVEAIKDTYEGCWNGLCSKVDFLTGEGGALHVSGVVKAGDDVVGTFERDLFPHSKMVEHTSLFLDADVQGNGFAKGFLTQSEAHYRAQGIEAIYLTASSSVGGYAWAKAGFDFTDNDGNPIDPPTEVRLGLDDALSDHHTGRRVLPKPIYDKAADINMRLQRGDHVTANEIARLGDGHDVFVSEYHPDRPVHLGAWLLLGTEWNGIKRLTEVKKSVDLATLSDEDWEWIERACSEGNRTVQKFNPYHDPTNGQFTTASGVGAGTGSTVPWRPTMTREEAEEWNHGTAFDGEVFWHVTQKRYADAISAEGFHQTVGILGEGVYLGRPDVSNYGGELGDHEQASYNATRGQGNGEGKATTLLLSVRATNPLVLTKEADWDLIATIEADPVMGPAWATLKKTPRYVEAGFGARATTEFLREQGYDAVVLPTMVNVFDPKNITVLTDESGDLVPYRYAKARGWFAKFNPYHDSLGRFTFGPGSGRAAVAQAAPWKPTMTREEAEEWAKDSVIQDVLTHTTSRERLDYIEPDISEGGHMEWVGGSPAEGGHWENVGERKGILTAGFKPGVSGVFGDGIYLGAEELSINQEFPEGWDMERFRADDDTPFPGMHDAIEDQQAREYGYGGDREGAPTLRVKVNVQNPFVVDIPPNDMVDPMYAVKQTLFDAHDVEVGRDNYSDILQDLGYDALVIKHPGPFHWTVGGDQVIIWNPKYATVLVDDDGNPEDYRYRKMVLFDPFQKYSPSQPRDALGRWTTTGASVGSTAAAHTVNGAWTAERARLHDEIVAEVLAGHEPSSRPVATFLGGGTASGKSSVLGAALDNLGVLIDPDALKAKIPEFGALHQKGDPRAAAYVHEESSYLSKRLLKEASDRGLSLTLDGTGDSTIDRLRAKVEEAREDGHLISAKYVTVSVDEAIRRANIRGHQTGRFVPESFIREVHASVTDAFSQAIDENLFDEAQLWDNNGSSPVLVGEKTIGGTWVVHETALWDDFLAKGGAVTKALARGDMANRVLLAVTLGHTWKQAGLPESAHDLFARMSNEVQAIIDGGEGYVGIPWDYNDDTEAVDGSVAKFNPYHDELGRFTTGPGESAAGKPTSSATPEERREQAHAALSKAFPRALIQVGQPGDDPVIAEAIVEALTPIAAEFPAVAAEVALIRLGPPETTTVSIAEHIITTVRKPDGSTSTGIGIMVNRDRVTEQEYQRVLREIVPRRWGTPQTTANGVPLDDIVFSERGNTYSIASHKDYVASSVLHEFGHAVHYISSTKGLQAPAFVGTDMNLATWYSMTGDLRAYTFDPQDSALQSWLGRARIGFGRRDALTFPTVYSNANIAELFAESFTFRHGQRFKVGLRGATRLDSELEAIVAKIEQDAK